MWYKKKTYKYYIEITNYNGEYIFQTKWFDTKEQAMNWLKDNVAWCDLDNYNLYIMKSAFEDGWHTDIEKDIQIDFDTLCKLRGY